MLSRKEQKEATKKLVFDTAIQLFVSHGYDQTSVDQIVQQAGVSKGTFYHHFVSKSAVLLEYANSMHIEMLKRMRDVLRNNDNESAADRVNGLFGELVRFHEKNYAGLRLLVDHARSVSVQESAFSAFLSEIQNVLVFLLNQGQASEELSSSFQPQKAALYITRMYYQDFLQCMEESTNPKDFAVSFHQSVRQMLDMFLDGLKRRLYGDE